MEVFSGHLTLKISGFLKDKLYPNHLCVLYCGRNTLPPCIEVFEKDAPIDKKIYIELENCRWLEQHKAIKPAFGISIKGKHHTFIVQTEQERLEWVMYLGCVVKELSKQRSESTKSKSSGKPYEGVMMQDNVLYSSSDSDKTYSYDVIADHNQGICSTLKFTGCYSMMFDSSGMFLFEKGTKTQVAHWAYYSIRQYGTTANTFHFLSGKSSNTGEGLFSFLTSSGKAMANIITQQTIKIKQEKKSQVYRPNLNSSNVSKGNASADSGNSTQNSGKKKPAPLAPFNSQPTNSGNSASSAGADSNFKQQLNNKLVTPSSPSTSSVENSFINKSPASAASSESLKDKKKQKENEKEIKKQEKKDAKLKKQKEKEESKAKAKKEKTKAGKPQPPPKLVSSLIVDDHTYAEPNDNYTRSCHTDIEDNPYDLYSDCNNLPMRKPTEVISDEAQYAPPWTDRISDINNPSTAIDEESVYALPQRRDTNRPKASAEDYEDYNVDEQTLPPEIPKRADIDHEQTNSEIYDHFNSPDRMNENPENVYGIESASVPLVPKTGTSENGNSSYVQDEEDGSVYE